RISWCRCTSGNGCHLSSASAQDSCGISDRRRSVRSGRLGPRLHCFSYVTMPKKKKHPMHMTDEEALKHLFHPEIVKAVRKHVKGQSKQEQKPKPKPKPKR